MDFEIISFFGTILLFTGFFVALELFLIYFSPPKKLEINGVNSTAPLKIYTNYFFLPFRTKVTEYHTLKNIELSVNRDMSSAKKHNIYELILHIPGKNISLKKGNKKELSKECEVIIQSINSSGEYVLLNNSSFQMSIVVCFFVFILFLICLNGKPEINIMTDGHMMELFMSYMISALIFFVLVLSSVILNSLDRHKNKKTNKEYDINEESIKEWNRLAADAQKIYDSLIK